MIHLYCFLDIFQSCSDVEACFLLVENSVEDQSLHMFAMGKLGVDRGAAGPLAIITECLQEEALEVGVKLNLVWKEQGVRLMDILSRRRKWNKGEEMPVSVQRRK